MSYYTIQQFQDDLMRKVKCEESSDFFGLIDEAIRNLLSKCDPLETKRTNYVEYGVFGNQSRYYVPEDLKNKRVIDIRKQVGRTYRDDYAQTSERTFDKYNSTSPYLIDNHFTIEHVNGRRYLRFADHEDCRVYCINSCDKISDWNTYGSITNLRIDNLNFTQGKGSLRFDIGTGTFGAIEWLSPAPINILKYKQIGSLFLSMYTNKIHDIQSIALKWGSSATDYYSFTITSPHNYIDFVEKWQQLKFPYDDMTVTGTPNDTAISNFRIEFNTTGVEISNVRIDSITINAATLYEIRYYSDWIIRNPQTLEFKSKPTSASDEIVLDSDGYELLLLEGSILLAEEVRKDEQEIARFERQLKDKYINFNQDHKSEYEKPIEYYYKRHLNGNDRYGYYGYGYGNGGYR